MVCIEIASEKCMALLIMGNFPRTRKSYTLLFHHAIDGSDTKKPRHLPWSPLRLLFGFGYFLCSLAPFEGKHEIANHKDKNHERKYEIRDWIFVGHDNKTKCPRDPQVNKIS
jgi:hypothetical protein